MEIPERPISLRGQKKVELKFFDGSRAEAQISSVFFVTGILGLVEKYVLKMAGAAAFI